MLQNELNLRNIPDLMKMNDGRTVTAELWPERRAEILQILYQQEYGYTPAAPERVTALPEADFSATCCAGKGTDVRLRLSFETEFGPFSFPIRLIQPCSSTPVPMFVCIAFRPDVPDRYLPVEEIVDRGYGVAVMYYEDIVNDVRRRDFNDHLGAIAIGTRARRPDEWGKIGMWAYCASRVLDYLLTRDDVDHDHIAVIGHSRLGKTALWCGAQDERFYLTISNDSGCGGAALFRGKGGEHVSNMQKSGFVDWFCPNYETYGDREEEMPYDQHFVAALVAPRKLAVGSAVEDLWADPKSEYLTCCAADEVYRLLGKKGFEHPDHFPEAGDCWNTGDIAYHLRPFKHFLSRTDWNRYMDFFDRCRAE